MGDRSEFSAKFKPGDRVTIGEGSIRGVIDTVEFGRNMTAPTYRVEWFGHGDLFARHFHEDDIEKDLRNG